MKKALILLALFLGTSFLHAELWMHDYDDALAKAQKVHKPIIMMYSAKS